MATRGGRICGRDSLGAVLGLAATLVVLAGCEPSRSIVADPTDATLDRAQRARAEIAGFGDHTWAGEYTSGMDTVGMFVLLSPTEGALEGGWSCLQPRSLHYLGEVERVSEHFVTIRADAQSDPILERLGGRLVRFRWGERRYVAWPEQLAAVETLLDEGTKLGPRTGLFMVHADDQDKEPGTPEELEGVIRELCRDASIREGSEHGPP
ncbi:MAG: hypothetical protein IT431_10940 [Phycisphaerales bacterium]|nr:hypothetical protein [Phycisphaerales bacterium]